MKRGRAQDMLSQMQRLIEDVDEAKGKLNRLEGRMESTQARMKALGCKGAKEVKAKLVAKRREMDEAADKAEKIARKIEEKYGDKF